jgi:flagellar motility protein MotE (MotC chaperone)
MACSKRKPRRIWHRFSLFGVIALFILSGLFRLGAIGFASASVSADDPAPGPEEPELHAGMMNEPAGQCSANTALEQALSRVEGRAERLDAREESLAERARALGELEASVAAQLAALEATEERLESLLALSDTAAESDLARLTQVYETMDAADAAALFSQMDPGFAAGFLGRMQADAAAGVMAELDPGVAYTISVLIATRNASAPVSASAAPGTP